MAGFNILTVTQITSYLKSYIDENKKLSGIYIKGEITDFKANYSGNKDQLTLQVEELTKEVEDFKYAQQNVVYDLDKNKNEITDLMYDIQTAQKKLLTLEAQKNAYE